jgi:hypothetical protein
MAPIFREPLHPNDAKRLIRHLLEVGTISYSPHAEQEMAADDLTMVDCTNVLRGGVVAPPEWERGSWRYCVRTARMCVVVAFRSPTHLRIVTAWRI